LDALVLHYLPLLLVRCTKTSICCGYAAAFRQFLIYSTFIRVCCVCRCHIVPVAKWRSFLLVPDMSSCWVPAAVIGRLVTNEERV